MDYHDIESIVRSRTKLATQQDMHDLVMRRYINLGMHFVAQTLLPMFQPFLVRTKEITGETGTGVDVPGDMLSIIDVEREDSDSIMRLATQIPVGDKGLVGKNSNVPGGDDQYPSYCHEGRTIQIFPSLSSTDVNVRYRRRIADLIDGKLTYASATTGTLGGNAYPEDDYYNDYLFAVYIKTATTKTLVGIYRCTDYVGSTKVATFSGVTLSSGTVYSYALVPIVPDELHNFIVDSACIEIKKAGGFSDGISWENDYAALEKSMNTVLVSNGFMKR